MNQITLTAQVRTEQGSKAAGRLRRAGKIPGIVKRMNGEPTLIELDAHDYEMAMRGHHGDQLLVTIDLGATKLSALLRELQHDVISGKVIHADFGEVDMGHTVRVEIALNLVGVPDGVKNANGVLEQDLRAVHVDCLPGDIVESFDVDVSAMKIGDKLNKYWYYEDIGNFKPVLTSDIDQKLQQALTAEESAIAAAGSASGSVG